MSVFFVKIEQICIIYTILKWNVFLRTITMNPMSNS